MAYTLSYCGKCGNQIPKEDYSNTYCNRCSEAIEREIELAVGRLESSGITSRDAYDVRKAIENKYGPGYQEVRCDYGGNCGSIVEDGGDLCPLHRASVERRMKEDKEEQDRRWREFEQNL